MAASKKKKKKKKNRQIDFDKIKMILKYNIAKFVIPFAAVVALGIILIVFAKVFEVKTVTVEGSSAHYTSDEIIDYVLDSKLCRNSLFVFLKYKNKSVKDLPFVEQIDVKLVDIHTVKISVYDKYVAGCISNLGNYLYFDNEGKVVEVSKQKTMGVPVVTGLNITHFELYEELPVANKDVFDAILNITKLLNKYDLSADIIYFGENGNITVFFDEVKVNLGVGDNLNEKVMVLPGILPSLEGKKGVLHLEKYKENDANIVFNEDV